MQERLVYQSDPGTANASAASFPTLATMYESLNDLRAVLRPGEVVVDLPHRDDRVDFKLDLSAAVVSASEAFMDERIYIVTPTGFDGKGGYLVELIALVKWTSGGSVIPPEVGGRAGHNYAVGVVLTTDYGIALARTGTAIKVINRDPAFVQLHGLGGASAIVRVFDKPDTSPADGIAPLGRLWF